ncbi:MAG: hypothetical protein ABW022_25175 [Actinoplanes sp.]
MAGWILVPCLVQLRTDLNAIAPGRDRASDGSIADNKHGNSSDHCVDETSPALRHKDADRTPEVHAIDVDKDLRTPGLDMEDVVQHILARCRSGAEKRLRYIIFNRRIWEASNGWRRRDYDGPNPHDHHAHFSSSYETAREASKASWHLEDIPMPLNAADKQWISAEIKKVVDAALAGGKQSDGTPTSKIGRDAWSQGVPNGLVNAGTGRDQAWGVLRDLGVAVKALDTKVTAALPKLTTPTP